jgi:hypothetical protein
MSSIVIVGDTSGSITLQAPAVSGSTVITLPSTSTTLVSSQWTTTGNDIYYNTGHVGVGITSFSTWGTGLKALSLAGGSLWSFSNAYTDLTQNLYYNGSSLILTNTAAASYYRQFGGVHSWYTAPSGTAGTPATVTQAMTLDASGNLGIGTTTPSSFDGSADNLVVGTTTGNNGITIAAGTSSASTINFADGTAGGAQYTGYIDYQHSGNYMRFGTNGGTERMRIDDSGNLMVGTSGLDGRFRVSQDGLVWARVTNHTYSGTQFFDSFRYNGTEIGKITGNNSNVSFVTSSDYRLKENIAPMVNALATVAQLKPCTYNWKLDGAEGQGFIAHELQAVVPDAVVGEKDAVDEDGKIKPQGIDTSFLVATLTAAIQEQQALITALTERITALEGV